MTTSSTICPACGNTNSNQQTRCSVCNAPVNAAQRDPLLGTTLGNFQLQKRIGRGGMGAIYRATHKVMGTDFAVKILHPQFASEPYVMERFRREAIAASQLQHDNVVFIADFGWDDRVGTYIVMEYLQGQTLGAALQQREIFPVQRLIPLFQQIGAALTAAHTHGIIHRDLKPDNIFLCTQINRAERVKILDFGIAKVLQENETSQLTQSNMALGTPSYMSPEQAAANWNQVDQRTDIFSLGVILYHILAGTTPIPLGSIREVTARLLTDQLDPLTQYRPDLCNHPVLSVIQQMLAHQPEHRFSSVAETLHHLIPALGQLPQETLDFGLSPISLAGDQNISRELLLQGSSQHTPMPRSSQSLPTPLAPPHHPLPPTQSFFPELHSPKTSQPTHSQLHEPSSPGVITPPSSKPWALGVFALFLGLAAGLVALLFTSPNELTVSTPQRRNPTPRTTIPPIHSNQLPSLLHPITPTAEPNETSKPAPPAKAPQILPLRTNLSKVRLQPQIPSPIPRPQPQRTQPTVTLRVQSTPSARVFRGKSLVCRTPCMVKEKRGNPFALTIKQTRYQTATYLWKTLRSRSISLTLRPASRTIQNKRKRMRIKRTRQPTRRRPKPRPRQRGLFSDVPF